MMNFNYIEAHYSVAAVNAKYCCKGLANGFDPQYRNTQKIRGLILSRSCRTLLWVFPFIKQSSCPLNYGEKEVCR